MLIYEKKFVSKNIYEKLIELGNIISEYYALFDAKSSLDLHLYFQQDKSKEGLLYQLEYMRIFEPGNNNGINQTYNCMFLHKFKIVVRKDMIVASIKQPYTELTYKSFRDFSDVVWDRYSLKSKIIQNIILRGKVQNQKIDKIFRINADKEADKILKERFVKKRKIRCAPLPLKYYSPDLNLTAKRDAIDLALEIGFFLWQSKFLNIVDIWGLFYQYICEKFKRFLIEDEKFSLFDDIFKENVFPVIVDNWEVSKNATSLQSYIGTYLTKVLRRKREVFFQDIFHKKAEKHLYYLRSVGEIDFDRTMNPDEFKRLISEKEKVIEEKEQMLKLVPLYM